MIVFNILNYYASKVTIKPTVKPEIIAIFIIVFVVNNVKPNSIFTYGYVTLSIYLEYTCS